MTTVLWEAETRSLGLDGHQPISMFSERPRFKGILRETEQGTQYPPLAQHTNTPSHIHPYISLQPINKAPKS